MSQGRNPILVVIYSVIGIVIVLICTVFTLKLIVDLWYPPFFKTEPVEQNIKVAQMKALASGIVGNDNYSIGYKMPVAVADKNNFHNIQVPDTEDRVSLCVTCHGIMPHDYNLDMRSFRNKHDANIACETCHIVGKGNPGFAWYNVNNGAVVKKIDINGALILSDYKIIAFYGGVPAKYDKSVLKKDAEDLLLRASKLSASERREMIKPFHENLTTAEDAVKCVRCHTADNGEKSFLPLLSLGYSQGRIRMIMNSEVIGLLMKYNEFYLPSFLNANGKTLNGDTTVIAPLTNDNESLLRKGL